MTPKITDNAEWVKTGIQFAGFETGILVPLNISVHSKQIVTEYVKKMHELMAIAKQPSLKELAIMSAKAIPNLIKRALSGEN